MTLALGFVLTNYILYSLGIAALFVSEALSPPIVLFSFLLLFVLFVAELKEKIPIMKDKYFWGYYIGPIILIISYYIFLLPLLETFCYFFLIVLFTRIIYKKEINDYLFCSIISLACLLIGAMGTAEFSFALIFISFFIVISWSMILYHLRVEKEDELKSKKSFIQYTFSDGKTFQKEKIGGSFFALTSLFVLGSLVITLLIFFLMPRLGEGFFRLHSKSRQSISGFSKQVELGDIGRIKLDQSIVMRIETYQNERKIKPEGDIYWRGIALDQYDGKRWSNTFSDNKKIKRTGRDSYKIDDRKINSELIKHVVILEPIASDVIFAAGRPISLTGPFKWISVDYNNSLFRSVFPSGRIRMIVHSDISAKGRHLLSPHKDSLSVSDKEKYLQLPPLSSRFLEFTKGVVEDTGVKHQQAAAIESYLKTNFGYTLDQSFSRNISPIDNFLFESKEGHCEYFASAMVLMLRTLDIPARLVNGFLKGEWNEVGEYLLVRQSYAHSWVEAMLDDKGWVVFDPTPAAAIPAVSSSFFAGWEQYLDAIRMKWYRYIINFSSHDQQTIAINVRNKGFQLKDKLDAGLSEIFKFFKIKIKNSQPDKIAIFVILLVFALILGKKIVSITLLIGKNKTYSQGKSLEIYFKMLALLKKKGFEKKETVTPLEFVYQIENEIGSGWGKVKTITDAFYETRFGNGELSKERKKELELSINYLAATQ